MQTRDTVSLALAIAVPVLMALAAAAAWILVGRSLKPVEDIRAQVADISGSDLHRRVPVPASRDEIGRLAVTMNAMLDRLESSARRQRRFVADASHELRSPIAVIRAQLEVALGERKDPPDWPEVARSALAHADRLVELIEHLLIMARSVDGSHPSRPRPPVDLDELILSELDRLPNPTGVDIDASRVSAGRVDGDPELLRRMTTNLLANGTRHARSRLRVELQRRHGWVEFVVSDDGPGVAPGDRESVFEPFTRLDEGRSRDAGGSGLGLAIVKEVVIAHGGTVRLEDARPGARFVVRLPQSEDAHGGQPEYGRGKLAHHFRRSRSLSQP
jgi:signal transduction histidine kinase